MTDVLDEVKTELVQPKNLLKAHRKDNNVLILAKLESPIVRFDGKRVSFRLEYRWLSNPDDVHSVQGNEFTYWSKRELQQTGAIGDDIILFDAFNLF